MRSARLLAGIAVIALLGFYGVMIWFVPRLDLTLAILIGVALVAYDLWTQLFARR